MTDLDNHIMLTIESNKNHQWMLKILDESLSYNLQSLKVFPYNLLFNYNGKITAAEKPGKYHFNQVIQVSISNGAKAIICLLT